MIIRRKYTANFTTIGNALFNDERLAADELGILAYLRSKPEDWEVKPIQLRKRFGLGRDSMRRIMRSAIKLGWVVARVTRLSNGTISVIYEVRDEAGPELSDEEARAALSLVSSGAGSTGSSDDDGPDDDPPESEGADPPTGQPGAASRLRQTHPGPIRESLKTDSVNTESPNGACAFSGVLGLWPRDHVVSSFACEKLHAELTDTMRQAAHDGVRPYLEDCRANNRKVCDLATYYRERRWERFQAVKANTSITSIKPYGPEFYRWREYRLAIGDHAGVKAMDVMAQRGSDITVPSRWPPGMGQSPPTTTAA